MTYEEFLRRTIDEGIEAARQSYQRPDQAHKLEGSIAGFEACRDKKPAEILALLTAAEAESRAAMHGTGSSDDDPALKNYWRLRCKTLEIEWVANVLSAALVCNNLQPIVPPTARGMFKAASILGVEGTPSPITVP